MKLRYPAYYREFVCTGGDCPDNCCHGWEVVLDEQAVSFYRALPGPLGDKLRASMTEVDAETCFRMEDGRCPMLNGRGLCEIQLAHGPEGLSRSCDQHPRFLEEYGTLRELSLSMGCPEAARLLLGQSGKTTLMEETTDEQVAAVNDLDPRLFYALLDARRAAIELVQDRSLPRETRRDALLCFAEALQRKLDQHRIGQLEAVTDRLRGGGFAGRHPALDGAAFWPLLGRLEPIDEHWPALLAAARDVPTAPVMWEHLTVYYLFRYFLKAVVDRRLCCRVRLGVCSADVAGRFAREDLYRYCRQVEHSEPNFKILLDALS